MLEKSHSLLARAGGRRSLVLVLSALCFVAFVNLVAVGLYRPDLVYHPAVSVINKVSGKAQQPQTAGIANAREIHGAASNRTLGLDSIHFINLDYRHDRYDALAIASYVADIDVQLAPAFPAKDAAQDKIGFPPTSRPGKVWPVEMACYRAHANVWQKMLLNKTPATLILESDAGWDANLRPIMGLLNEHFLDLLQEENPHTSINATADDPWASRSGLWDIIGVGQCADGRDHNGRYRLYQDQHALDREWSWEGIDIPGGGARAVYRANSLVCLTGYILSLRGAAKLLVRSSLDLDEPIDMLIMRMVIDRQLTVYNVRPQPIAQWVYAPAVGMESRGANSDIRNNGTDSQSGDRGGNDQDGWADVQRKASVWDVKPQYVDAEFRDFALARAWGTVFGPEIQPSFRMPEKEERESEKELAK